MADLSTFASAAAARSSIITKGPGGIIQDGNGIDIVSSMQLGVVRKNGANLRYNGTSQLPDFYLPQQANLVITFIPANDYSTTDFANVRALVNEGEAPNRVIIEGPFTKYGVKQGIISNASPGLCSVGTARTVATDVEGLLEVAVRLP